MPLCFLITACLLVASLAHAHHDHSHEDEETALIMLEIQPNTNDSAAKDKRSPQHQTSQAIFGASPGQFVVRTSEVAEPGTQADVPPEYINLLQQLVSQQHQGEDTQAQLPVINQLLVAR